ncbi:MAG: hypothetical protein H7A44_08250 [Opitutaceae bacterium]|nr:hypothetical protein [Cephaloticoccus sp.]MCP5530421.1 hypothetical protein [Opitutaceae bacterium]
MSLSIYEDRWDPDGEEKRIMFFNGRALECPTAFVIDVVSGRYDGDVPDRKDDHAWFIRIH